MRIITGSARGTKLESLEGLATRPTAGKVKEALFSMIQFDIEGREVLDLFAGTGQLGLEALSRGAKRATFVDNSNEAIAVIKRNAQKTKLYEKCRVLTTEAGIFIKNAGQRGEKYDIIFLDPPYADKSIGDIVEKIMKADILAPFGLIVCESNNVEPIEIGGLNIRKHSRYGKTYITLFQKEQQSEE